MQNHEDHLKQADRDKLEEGKKIKDQMKKYKETLEEIRAKKLNELEKLGIDQKYQAELKKKNIVI